MSVYVHTGCQCTHQCVCARACAWKFVCSDVLALSLFTSVSQHVPTSACVCARVCAQLSQVCVINQLSGQFICWVTSCNFPPDSRRLCQVGITLRAHDKTLHLSASFPLFFCSLSGYCLFFFSALFSAS